MKNKNEKGITLITLVSSVVVLLIIGGITIVTGSKSIKSAQFMKFQSELTMVQSKINEVSLQYQREGKTLECEVTDARLSLEMEQKQAALAEAEEVKQVLAQKAAAKGVTVEDLEKGLHLCTKDYLREELGLEGLERNYLINLEETIVVSLEKFEYEGTNYYMLEQIPSSLYNVTYNNQIPSTGDFEVSTIEVAGGFQVTITPKHDKYVSKWQIKYKLKDEDTWKTEENLVFKVTKPGTYEIKVTHGDDVDLGTQTVVIKAGKTDENGYYIRSNTINGQVEGSAYNPVIPKDFMPYEDETTGSAKWGDGTSAPTREAVNSGLVIKGKDGSQYVWIPVDGVEVKLNRYVFDENGNTTAQDNSPITVDGFLYEELQQAIFENSIANNIEEFKNSVQTHGGYYIARFEASKGSNGKALSTVSQGTPSGNDETPITENMLWNWVTQNEASDACQELYTEIKSDLINSYAWDTAITFIQKNSSDNNNYSNKVDAGNRLSNAGKNGDVVCNIYGMGSNCAEWTTETSSDPEKPCVFRGADCITENQTTSTRVRTTLEQKHFSIGFRSILYW